MAVERMAFYADVHAQASREVRIRHLQGRAGGLLAPIACQWRPRGAPGSVSLKTSAAATGGNVFESSPVGQAPI